MNQGRAPKPTLVLAPDRVSALVRALNERRDEINAERVLHLEIDCGDEGFSLRITHLEKFFHRSVSDDV